METATRRHWACRLLAEATSEEVVATNDLCGRALDEAEVFLCCWNRGLVLAEWTAIPQGELPP
eukprot:1733116-Lingulodinium_polyedra.AAC.1